MVRLARALRNAAAVGSGVAVLAVADHCFGVAADLSEVFALALMWAVIWLVMNIKIEAQHDQ